MSTLKDEAESSLFLYPQYLAQSKAHSRDSVNACSMSEWKNGGHKGKDPINHDGQVAPATAMAGFLFLHNWVDQTLNAR